MRLISLVLGLAVLLWIIYTYQQSSTLKPEGDKTVKQQAVEDIDKAKTAASQLQQSVQDQAKLIQKAAQN